MNSLTTQAPAKINLSLRIAAKRPDGFHELETLVLPLPNLTDELIFTEASEFSLKCDTPGVPTDESNLVSRALRLFEQNTGKTCSYQINLTKNIPHGAGLGGGSADAAHTFLALNELTEAGVSKEELSEWAGQLGSDIPLFLYQSPCWCRGRGEIIEPTTLNWSAPLLLFKPAFDIPTPWAYSRYQDSKELEGFSYQPSEVDFVSLFNNLERPVFEKHIFLGELKRFLLEQPETQTALMSGSGSTVFAALHPGADAQALRERTLKELDPTLWTHLVNFK